MRTAVNIYLCTVYCTHKFQYLVEVVILLASKGSVDDGVVDIFLV